MSLKPKILSFAGSLRKESLNKAVAQIAAQGAQEAGAEVTYIDLLDYTLPIYNEDDEKRSGIPENGLKLKRLFMEHEALLLSLPEYNGGMSAVFKNTIDWVSRPHPEDPFYLCCFFEKPVALLSASPGNLGGLRNLRLVREMFLDIGSLVLPKQKAIPLAALPFNEKTEKDIKEVGAYLTEFLRQRK